MKNIAIFITILFTLLPGVVFAEDFVVQIGTEKYTYNDLKNIMDKNGFSIPDQAIGFIQNEQVQKGLKSRKADVYQKFFGKDAGLDAKYANHPEVIIKSKQAVARLSIFDAWFENKARKLDMIYLDIERYWDLVKATESYRVRENSGRKLDYSVIPYTAAELKIEESRTLVLKDGNAYISAKEYNDYVNENYEAIRDFVKRGKSKPQAKSEMIRKMTSEKLLAEKTDIRKSKIDGETVSLYLDKYSNAKMFDADLALGTSDFLSPATIRAAVLEKYKATHSERLNKIRSILEGATPAEGEEYAVKSLLQNIKLDSVRFSIMETLNKEKVESWMKANKFPGSMQEAAFIMLNDEYNRAKEAVIKENNIVFNDSNL